VAQVAADHPDRVLATVLTGPTFDPAEPSLLRHILRLIAAIPYERPSLLFEHVPDWIQAGLPRAIATLRHAWSHRIEAVLPHHRASTVVVRGEHDALVPRRWAVEAARLAPNGRALEIRGAAHALTYDAPVSLARIIEDVVASVESAARRNGDGLLPIRIVTATHRRRPNARPRRTRAGPPRA
jgi:pimeloyl-ACP methyl ester carboxylesterase